MKRIGFLTTRFLDLSETFIYEPLKLFTRVSVNAYALQRRNEAVFPYDRLFISEKKKALEERMRQGRLDVLHAHYGYMGVYALSFCKKNKIPLITSFYGLDVYQHTRSPFYRWQLRQLFKYGILFLACSEKMRNDLIKLGAPADKTKVQYGGATLSRFPYSQRAPEKEITILMCGRFVEKKGFQYGIDAFNRISAEFPQVKLKIIGSGSLESVLKKAAGKNIEFLGAKSHAEYIEEIKKCHIFMSPSVTAKNGDSEGLPTVLIEAAAIGRPLIATKHSGIPEIVHDGKNGLLVPERDVPALADVLRKMLRKPEAWIDFSRYGRALVEKSFDLTKQAQKLEAYYLA